MIMPGPRPIPTHLKLLRGNPGHQKLNKHEPQPARTPEVPEPPAFLAGYAADEWKRVAPGLYHCGLLTIIDVQPLAAYCSAYSRWRTAEEVLRTMAERDPMTHGLLIKRADGAGPNPMVRIAANAAEAMVSFAGHFGMSPAARARIAAGVGFEPPPGGKFDGLIG
jgi:P27 family predicted phage terminase small subunit